MEKKTRYILWTVMGALWLLAGIAGTVTGRQDATVAGMFITCGVIILVFSLGRAMRTDEGPEQDERTRRIGAYGITYSWFVTLVYLFALFWAQNAGLFALSSPDVILSSILLMAISAKAFQWWFFRKGDVE